jgi:hypothetical protein
MMLSTRVRSLVLVTIAVGLGTCIPAVQADSVGGEDYNDGSGNSPGLTYMRGSTTIGEAGNDKAWSLGPVNWIDTTDVNSGSVFLRALVQRQRDEAQLGGVSFFTNDQNDEIVYFGAATSEGTNSRTFFGLHDQESGDQAASEVTFDVGTTHLIVGQLDIDGGKAKLWIDPAFGVTPPAPDVTVSFAMNPAGKEVGSVRLNASGDPGFIVGDEVLVGTTWNDVVPTASDNSGIKM